MKLAFIGGSGHHYLRSLARDPANQIAVASDRVDDSATKEFLKQFGSNVQWFDSAADMLANFKPDIASVGAVYAQNGEFAAMCLERDIPTVSDKPVASTWPQYEKLAQLCEPKHRRLITEFDFRARQEFRAARDAVRKGELGEIVLITGQKSYRWGKRPSWYATREHYPSTLMWIGCHAIDAMLFVGNVTLMTVVAHQRNVTRPDFGAAEDHAVAMYEFANGGAGMIHADYLRPAKAPTHGDDRLRVAGSKGVLEVRDARCTLITNDTDPADITDRVPATTPAQAMLSAAMGESEEYFSTAHSLAMAKLLLQTRDAADSGKKVTL